MCMGCSQKRSATLKASSNGARQAYQPATAVKTGAGNGVRTRGSQVFGQPKIKLSFGQRNR